MSLADQILAVNNDLPIRTDAPVHSGKVRSVYWLTDADSKRLIQEKGYDVADDTPLAIMVISDRISAFDCIWQGEGGMKGVPGKGASLNAISNHWFKLFKDQGLADSHILDIPHPFVWIVQKAKPVMIEAICRQYITGSMWRSYVKGEREFCGIEIAEGLSKDSKLPELLQTPSTKGILEGIPGVPAVDDVNITRKNIEDNLPKSEKGIILLATTGTMFLSSDSCITSSQIKYDDYIREIYRIVKSLPENSYALLQKPMGSNYDEAKETIKKSQRMLKASSKNIIIFFVYTFSKCLKFC